MFSFLVNFHEVTNFDIVILTKKWRPGGDGLSQGQIYPTRASEAWVGSQCVSVNPCNSITYHIICGKSRDRLYQM